MQIGINIFWQTVLVSIIGVFVLKACAGLSAPKRSLLASGFMVIICLLPLLVGIYIFSNFSVLKYANSPLPIFEREKTVNFPITIPAAVDGTTQAENKVISQATEQQFLEDSTVFSRETIGVIVKITVLVWGAGFILMFFELLYGLIFLRGFRYGLTSVEDKRVSLAMETAFKIFNTKHLPEAYISSRMESPVTIGIFRPIMIFPGKLFSTLSENEVMCIVLHEFSHIYHKDHLIGLLKRVLIAVNWWNPLAYIISTEHSIAREEVSDNYVLSQIDARAYSKCLADLAEKTCLISSLPAVVGMADKHVSLKQRIENILSKTRRIVFF